MWIILKFHKKKISFLKKDFKEKLGNDIIFYSPKLLIEKINNKKIVKKEFSVLGDYIFFYHKKINQNMLNHLQFSRGLKYFLEGCLGSQKEIEFFINRCKKLENEKGYISKSLFEIIELEKYEFLSGPFRNQIFKILKIQNKKINILIGKFKTYIKKEDYLFQPIKS
tara:strand:+ start:4603 stop:5103 length:501 start_codon:yes stop_codon:yes gene_type:complete